MNLTEIQILINIIIKNIKWETLWDKKWINIVVNINKAHSQKLNTKVLLEWKISE